MEGAGDIVALAIPFAAGVAAGTLVSGVVGPDAVWVLPILSLALLLSILPFALQGHYPLLSYVVLFFLLGAFCHFSQALGLPARPVQTPLTDRACEALKQTIAAIPFPHERTGGLIQALLTGDRTGLSHPTREIFRQSGASHILALSGLHLGLIYLIIRRVLSLTGNAPAVKIIRCILTLITTGFYTLMTGAGPSIVRAFLYISIREISLLSPGRRHDPARVLLCALTIQLALRPSVITQVGFQLSYLAMLGITILFPFLKSWYPATRSRWDRFDPMHRIWDAAALTLSCQIFTAPLAWIRFHSFPKYFLLTNLLALPLSSAIMAVSAATVALSALHLCPVQLIRLNDMLIQTFLSALEVISTM